MSFYAALPLAAASLVAALALASPLPVPTVEAVGPVGPGPYAAQPKVALDPADPDRVALLHIALSKQRAADRPEPRLALSISADGGRTWGERLPFRDRQGTGGSEVDPSVAFGADGIVYAIGNMAAGVLLHRSDVGPSVYGRTAAGVSGVLLRQALADGGPAHRRPARGLHRARPRGRDGHRAEALDRRRPHLVLPRHRGPRSALQGRTAHPR